jgi:hypothetical protein
MRHLRRCPAARLVIGVSVASKWREPQVTRPVQRAQGADQVAVLLLKSSIGQPKPRRLAGDAEPRQRSVGLKDS